MVLWRNLLQLPVDLSFLATSFLFMSLIVHPGNATSTSVLLLLGVVLNIVAILIWKCTPEGLSSIRGFKFWFNIIASALAVCFGIAVIQGWSMA